MAAHAKSSSSLNKLACLITILCVGICGGVQVPKTIIESAVSKGAVCLDGSPPAYHLKAGSGEGAKSWLVYLQGAGWCLNSSGIYHTKDDNSTVQSCAERSRGALGSSHAMNPWDFNQLFDDRPNVSYFYNWNRVVVRYCDGGSFAGDADKPDPVTNLYYRGARIFRAVVKELMRAEGMRKGSNILLAGGSAGGLGVIIHCDRFVRLFSKHNVRVKCLADSSLFLRVQDPLRAKFFNTVFSTVVALHHPHKALPSKCTKSSNNSTVDCFFPKTLLNYIKSPIFILNPAFDSFQIKCTFGEDLYEQVKNHTVSKTDMVLLQDFRHQIIGALPPAAASDTKNGYLITSIYGHSLGTSSPQSYNGPMFADRNSEPFGSAILDWFFDRTPHVPHLLIDPADQPFYQA